MRTLVFIAALLFSSCSLIQKEQTKSIVVVDCPEPEYKLPEKCINKSDWDKIKTMRPFAQDIAVAILTRNDELQYDNGKHCWGINKVFWIWVSNGYSHFELYENVAGATFDTNEKRYLYSLYNKWFNDNYRIYKFEEEVTIKIVEK